MSNETARTVLMIGTFDSKPAEFALLREQLQHFGCRVLAMDVGVMPSKAEFEVSVAPEEVAQLGGESIAELRTANDRGRAMQCMSVGAAQAVLKLFREHPFHAVVGMGGSGGTSVVTAAMRALPLGIPKVCVSTVASCDTSPYVGCKDVVLIPSIVDVAGVNKISRRVITQAAAAVCGMAKAPLTDDKSDRPIIVASMFGNTTECVNQCRAKLEATGYEVLVFHAVGSGGRTMESLIEDEEAIVGCLDLTTTEWADELCGGIFGAGTDRLSAAGRKNVPHLIAPGCIDMVNFGAMETVPQKYRDANRLFYQWNPDVTLMRTTVEENRKLGEIFAEKANAAQGPVAFILPLKGVSILDGDGERFCDRNADQAMFDTLKRQLRDDIPVIEVDANINDPVFAQAAVDTMLGWINAPKH